MDSESIGPFAGFGDRQLTRRVSWPLDPRQSCKYSTAVASDEPEQLVAELGGLLLGEQGRHQRGAQSTAALGVEQPCSGRVQYDQPRPVFVVRRASLSRRRASRFARKRATAICRCASRPSARRSSDCATTSHAPHQARQPVQSNPARASLGTDRPALRTTNAVDRPADRLLGRLDPLQPHPRHSSTATSPRRSRACAETSATHRRKSAAALELTGHGRPSTSGMRLRPRGPQPPRSSNPRQTRRTTTSLRRPC